MNLGFTSGLASYASGLVMHYGLGAVFLFSLLESFVLPIPTALIIMTATAAGLNPLTVTLVATFGSVAGALVGYQIGLQGGRRALIWLFKKKTLSKVDFLFEKYGAWAVGIAAFTPIPFKVFTISAGVAKMRLPPFVLASIIGRFAQFLLFAYFGDWVGEMASLVL